MARAPRSGHLPVVPVLEVGDVDRVEGGGGVEGPHAAVGVELPSRAAVGAGDLVAAAPYRVALPADGAAPQETAHTLGASFAAEPPALDEGVLDLVLGEGSG